MYTPHHSWLHRPTVIPRTGTQGTDTESILCFNCTVWRLPRASSSLQINCFSGGMKLRVLPSTVIALYYLGFKGESAFSIISATLSPGHLLATSFFPIVYLQRQLNTWQWSTASKFTSFGWIQLFLNCFASLRFMLFCFGNSTLVFGKIW